MTNSNSLTIIKEDFCIDESLSTTYTLNKYTISGICEGQTVYIQSSVHGAELQGNLVIKEIISYLKKDGVKLKGEIIAVPMANPFASSQKIGTYTYGRFNPVTGDNWNRLYHNLAGKSLSDQVIDYDKFINALPDLSQETITSSFKKLLLKTLDTTMRSFDDYGISDNKKLFLTLQSFASAADIVLDLHTGPIATAYAYAPEYLKDKCLDTHAPHIILIPNEFAGAMDEATFYPWFVLGEKLKEKNISYDLNFESYTIELSSEEFVCSKRASLEAQRLIGLLIKRGIIEDENFQLPNVDQILCPLSSYVTYRAKKAGLYEYLKKPGEIYKKGDALMQYHLFNNLQELDDDNHTKIICANEGGIVINHTPTSNIKQGMDLMQCFKI